MTEASERDGQGGREEDLDRSLRTALEPGEARVGRVVRGALAARERRLPSVALVTALAAGVAVLVLLAALLLSALRGGSPPGEAPAAVARFHVTNRNGVMVVQDADGGATFLYSRERPSEPPRGMRMIVRGGTRP